MVKIFVLNGKGGSGKDTFINLLREVVKEQCLPYKIAHMSIVDPIKSAAMELGWSGKKDNLSRNFLYKLKQLVDEYNDYCFTYVKRKVNTWAKTENILIFVDMREEKDIESFLTYFSKYKPETILIKRPTLDKKTYGNSADDNAELMKNITYIIDNNGTIKEFKEKIRTFVKQLIDNN